MPEITITFENCNTIEQIKNKILNEVFPTMKGIGIKSIKIVVNGAERDFMGLAHGTELLKAEKMIIETT